jgi:carboxypeptidase Taq
LHPVSYALLSQHYRRLARLQHIEAIVSWDEATTMSAKGGADRGNALATLRGVLHDHATHPALGDWFATAAQESGLEPWQRANLREMRHKWERDAALSRDLVEAMATAELSCEQAWRRLRPTSDFAGLLPRLRDVVARKREVAQVLGQRLSLAPYDALIDGYEPGARAQTIAVMFTGLRAFLTDFIPQVVERQRAEPVASSKGPFATDRQRWLGLTVMRQLGFDFERGRLDISHHPFCGGVPSDVRITTRYDEQAFAKSLMGVIHETGHAMYEQNLPADWAEQPVAHARGMSVHEGQSLLFEMQMARSRPFIDFLAPLLVQAFPDLPEAKHVFAADNLARQLTRVKPSFIRVEADEVTYPCHIILRFNLEKALIEGTLRPEELPEAWDSGMRDLLGISTGDNHRDGCMQDVHWPAGLFGYFPAYTLGAMTAAQLFRAATRAIPQLSDQIRRGSFTEIGGWLRANVWSQGSFLPTQALLEKATGKPLGTEDFEAHLTRRYLEGES